MRNMIRSILRRRGYELRRVHQHYKEAEGYVLFDYKDESGDFDYKRYKDAQTEGNKRKINKVFVRKENIEWLSSYLTSRLGNISAGVCHGTRRGLEQQWFREFLGADVFGTEISETATTFPHTIEWDFHQAKPEWLDHFDFVYSNSLDHSYDPQTCLTTWISCLRPGGLCVLEHSEFQNMNSTSSLDPFGVELHIFPYLIAQWGKGDFAVREIVKVPNPIANTKHVFLIIQRFADRWEQARV